MSCSGGLGKGKRHPIGNPTPDVKFGNVHFTEEELIRLPGCSCFFRPLSPSLFLSLSPFCLLFLLVLSLFAFFLFLALFVNFSHFLSSTFVLSFLRFLLPSFVSVLFFISCHFLPFYSSPFRFLLSLIFLIF